MIFTYPAIFRPHDDGSFDGRFPDLAGCEVSGRTLDAALANAIEAARGWITVELTEEEEPHLPPVTHIDDLTLAEGEIVRSISCNVYLTEGWGD